MNFEQLETKLYSLTDSEKRYLQNDFLDYYSGNHSIIIDNREVYQFLLRKMIQETNRESYYIRKQSRFAPVPDHITDVIELNYVYHGKSLQCVNGNKITLNEGDLILIDTQVSHQIEIADAEDIIISVSIEQNFFKEYFFNHLKTDSPLATFLFQAISDSQNHNQYLLFRKNQSDNLKLLFQQLLCESYEPKLLDVEYKNHLLQLIFLELIRSFSIVTNGFSNNDYKQQLALDILSFIHQNYTHITLEKCAQHFGYNTNYFSSLVKDCTGSSFKTILQEERLEASLPLLLHSKESIRTISYNIGFSNLNQFYRLFKRKYGVTPATYRKK